MDIKKWPIYRQNVCTVEKNSVYLRKSNRSMESSLSLKTLSIPVIRHLKKSKETTFQASVDPIFIPYKSIQNYT